MPVVPANTEIDVGLATGGTPNDGRVERAGWHSLSIWGNPWGGATVKVLHKISMTYPYRQMLNTADYTVSDAVNGVVSLPPVWLGSGSFIQLEVTGGSGDSFTWGVSPQ